MALTLAITGGTGFVGGHAITQALGRGHTVRALARRPQQPREGLQWIAGSLSDEQALHQMAQGADAVVHIAGVTNAADAGGFEQGNVLGTAMLRRAIGALPLVHVSSLSAREPRLSIYGRSKLVGEQIACGAQGPVTIVRPPAVYGPGDREFLDLMRFARTGFVPFPAGSVAAMIYGPDLAEALLALAEDLAGAGKSAGLTLEIDDGTGSYTPARVAAAIGAAIGRTVRPLPVSPTLLKLAAVGDTAFARLQGRLPRITRDRAGYMAHPDWSVNSSPIAALGIWQPRTPLARGMAATAAWYRAQGLLP